MPATAQTRPSRKGQQGCAVPPWPPHVLPVRPDRLPTCRHLTQLERRVAIDGLTKQEVDNPETELVSRKGDEHERAYLDSLRAAGKSVTEIVLEPDLDWERAAREAADVIRSDEYIVRWPADERPDAGAYLERAGTDRRRARRALRGNERLGGKARLGGDELPVPVDEKLADRARINGFANFRLVFGRTFLDTVVRRMDDNEHIFKRILEEFDFRQTILDHHAERLVWAAARAERSVAREGSCVTFLKRAHEVPEVGA